MKIMYCIYISLLLCCLVCAEHTKAQAFDFNSFGKGLFDFEGLAKSLNNVNAELNDNMASVEATLTYHKLKTGTGGSTIADYGNGKILVIKDHQYKICKGKLNKKTAECDGNLEDYEPSNYDAVCFMQNKIVMNNMICSSNSALNMNQVNGKITCETSSGAKLPLFTQDEYEKRCGRESDIKYIYVPNKNDKNHVEIPSSNPYVKCNNESGGYCEFKSDIQEQKQEKKNLFGNNLFNFDFGL